MQSAGTGNGIVSVQDKLFRSDLIYWLDRSHHNAIENLFLDIMDQFVVYLNETCYTGITEYEFHYALYEKGSFYKKHVDQFQSSDLRKYSMIFYLNEGWEKEDGGQLCIHHEGGSLEMITPLSGKMVFFKSNELQHEVLLANKARMSITGWLKTTH
jgi:SM-20-related protein